MAEAMKAAVASMLKGINKYNPDNLQTLENYVDIQAREGAYDLEANLAVLKLYQLNPSQFQISVTTQILFKALTNFPHTDFILCKCLINQDHLRDPEIQRIMNLADLLEMCQFKLFWQQIQNTPNITAGIKGFDDCIRKFICHVVNITYQRIEKNYLCELLGNIDDVTLKQWINKYGWYEIPDNLIFIANQEENIKTKNITEKINFESVASIMSQSN